MRIQCLCKFRGGKVVSLEDCTRLILLRERYQPCGILHAQFLVSEDMHTLPVSVKVSVGEHLVHEGTVQQAEWTMEGGERLLHITSRSFSVQLLRNQLAPGLYSDVTLSSLIEANGLSHIYLEPTDFPNSYVYVRARTNLWDAIVSYCYKLNHGYPYVRVPNCLCIAPQKGDSVITLPKDRLVKYGTAENSASLISHIEMEDIDGTLGGFQADDAAASDYEMVRVQHISFDRQYLQNPPEALAFRLACGKRKLKQKTVTYVGYCGEDLEDRVSAEPIGTARVSRILISGTEQGILTTDTFYFDPFCNAGQTA